MTIPNFLTILRIILVPVFIVASLQGAFGLAFFVFIAAAVTDALDGFIARAFNQRSKLGAVLDPGADKMMLVSGYLVFTLPGIARHRLPVGLTVTVFLRDVLIVFIAYLLYTRIRVRRFPPSIPGKLSTIFQSIALGVTMAANTFLAPVALPLAATAQKGALLMTLYSGWDYLRLWSKHIEEEAEQVALAGD